MKALRVWITALSVVAASGLIAGCRCTAEKRVVVEIEKTQAIMDAEYLNYTEHDPLLKPEDKADRKKLIESRQRLLDKLKKSLE